MWTEKDHGKDRLSCGPKLHGHFGSGARVGGGIGGQTNHVIGFPFPLAHLVHEWVESCGYKPSRTAPSKTPLFTLCPPARLLQPCRGGTGVYSGLQSLCGLSCLFLRQVTLQCPYVPTYL